MAGQHGHGARYAPQSDTIQGILKDMYDTFTSNLEKQVKAEGEASTHYEEFMHLKQEELATLKETLLKKEKAKAEAETMLAEATVAFADTEKQLAAEVEFF